MYGATESTCCEKALEATSAEEACMESVASERFAPSVMCVKSQNERLLPADIMPVMRPRIVSYRRVLPFGSSFSHCLVVDARPSR